jgi:hypothetical protein
MATNTKTPVKKTASRKPTFGQTLSSLAMFAGELLVPALLAVGIIAWLFTNYNLWSMGAVLAQTLFYLAVVLVAFMLTVLLDMLTASGRAIQGVIGGGPRARLVKFVLGGLILPIALGIAVNLVILPTGGTVLNTFINMVKSPLTTTPPDEVGRITLETNDPAVKRSGIEVLSKFQSPAAFIQLLRLAKEDRAALRDATSARALAAAIAAYGGQARDPLLELFNSIDPTEAGGTLPDDLYGRYFSAGFSGLQAEVQANDPDRLTQVEAARAQLEAALQGLHAESVAGSGGDPRPLFILQTFQAMNLSSEDVLLAFALKTAADVRYPAAVRGEALLLVGKLGKEGQLSALYAYMDNPDTFVQTRALQAISAIMSKGAAPAKRK